MFHELGHTQHYAQVGNSFWTSHTGYIVQNGGYGEKTTSGSGRVAISEAWAGYIGYTFTADRHEVTKPIEAERAISYLEYQYPGNARPNNWIVYGMLHDMTDNTELYTGVIDNVNSYNTAAIFQGLQPNVTDVRAYQAQVLSQNNQRQAVEMNNLVSSYGW